MTEDASMARRYAGKSVLVTGGTGFIGTHLSRRLAGYGAAVVVLGRHAGDLAQGVELVLGDIRSEASVNALIARRFDLVFNLAAYSGQVPSFTDHEQSLTTNCLGHLNLLEAIRTLSPETTMCFASSRLVYGRTQYLPVDEEHPKEARSFYGIHKRTCEEYCEYYALRFGVRSVALRITNPYGPHDPAGHHRYNVANWMIDELIADRGVTVFGRGEQLRDYLYIDDAVDAMLCAAIDPRACGRVYNVGSGSGVALVDFVQVVIGAADRSVVGAFREVVRFLRADLRNIAGVFAFVLMLVVVATLLSLMGTWGLGLIAFVPLAGLLVLPLQLGAWFVRSLLFQYLGLTALTAYLTLYRSRMRVPDVAASGGVGGEPAGSFDEPMP